MVGSSNASPPTHLPSQPSTTRGVTLGCNEPARLDDGARRSARFTLAAGTVAAHVAIAARLKEAVSGPGPSPCAGRFRTDPLVLAADDSRATLHRGPWCGT